MRPWTRTAADADEQTQFAHHLHDQERGAGRGDHEARPALPHGARQDDPEKDELEININSIDPKTFHLLDRMIRGFLPDTARSRRRKADDSSGGRRRRRPRGRGGCLAIVDRYPDTSRMRVVWPTANTPRMVFHPGRAALMRAVALPMGTVPVVVSVPLVPLRPFSAFFFRRVPTPAAPQQRPARAFPLRAL